MTIPLFSRTCDRCGYEDRGGYGGPCEYALTNGDGLRIHTQLGWCHNCGKLESIENLDPTLWLGEIRFVRDRIASIRAEKNLFSVRWTYDNRYSTLDGDCRTNIAVEDFADWTYRIDRAFLGFKVLSENKRPPRCLSCGGTKYEPVEYRQDPNDPGRKQLIHPGCGGVLRSEWAGDIFVKGPRAIKRYTLDGDFIGWFREGEPVDEG